MDNKRLEQLISIFDQGSKDPFIKYAIATEYLKEENIPLALKFYEDLITNHKDYVGTYYHLGRLYDSLGRKEDAKTYGVCYCEFANGQKQEYDLTNLSRQAQLDQCDTHSKNAANFGGVCKLE